MSEDLSYDNTNEEQTADADAAFLDEMNNSFAAAKNPDGHDSDEDMFAGISDADIMDIDMDDLVPVAVRKRPAQSSHQRPSQPPNRRPRLPAPTATEPEPAPRPALLADPFSAPRCNAMAGMPQPQRQQPQRPTNNTRGRTPNRSNRAADSARGRAIVPAGEVRTERPESPGLPSIQVLRAADDRRVRHRSPSPEMPTAVAVAQPIGRWSDGANGPHTVLRPIAYGRISQPERDFLNSLSRASGALQLTLAHEAGTLAHRRRRAAENRFVMEGIREAGVIATDVATTAHQHLSPRLRQAFGDSLDQIQAYNIATADHFVSYRRNNGRDSGTAEPMVNQKGDLIFVPMMLHRDRISVTNAVGELEFSYDPAYANNHAYNRRWWAGHQEVRYLPGGDRRLFGTVRMAALVPRFAMTPTQAAAHDMALDNLRRNGGAVENSNCLDITLKGVYSGHFIRTMSSNLVAVARERGFQPVWIVKNLALLKSPYGRNNIQFSTISLQPRSYVALLGFSKLANGRNPDGPVTIVSLVSTMEELLAIDG